MFVFVQNGKFSSKNSIFVAGIEGRTAKYIITSGGQNENPRNLIKSPSAYRQGDKGPNNAQPDQKGRDASGASSGAEALIAAPYMLNYECFRKSDLSAKGAPL